MAAKVAVILINRNGFGLTEACVKSLVETGYPNLVIIIVDNGSNQTEIEKLTNLEKEYPNIILHPMGYNAGFTKANNAGIKMALDRTADYIWILNNDTEVRKDAIDLLVRAFDEHKLDKRNTILSSIITFADGKRIWCNGLNDLPIVNFPKSVHKNKPVDKVARDGLVLKPASYSVGCSMFFAREFVEQHGLMNEEYFIYFDDLDYSLGCNNLFIQQPLVIHKVSATSGFKGSERYTPFQAYLFAKNGIHFYFRRKNIPWYEKIVYLGFTVWVFFLRYIRDLRAAKAFLQGILDGLRGKMSATGGVIPK
jgi:GT2 family glycosyltransferase